MTLQLPFPRAVAGVAAAPGSGGDGGPATLASLLNPTGVAVDTSPNAGLFITGQGRRRGQGRPCQVASRSHTSSEIDCRLGKPRAAISMAEWKYHQARWERHCWLCRRRRQCPPGGDEPAVACDSNVGRRRICHREWLARAEALLAELDAEHRRRQWDCRLGVRRLPRFACPSAWAGLCRPRWSGGRLHLGACVREARSHRFQAPEP